MIRNMGGADRTIRIVAAFVLAYLATTLGGTAAMVAGVLAAIMLVTSIVGFCPVYRLVGLSTCPMPRSAIR